VAALVALVGGVDSGKLGLDLARETGESLVSEI
jgi:hypothetical protein